MSELPRRSDPVKARRALAVFEAAIELPEADRSSFLVQAYREAPELKQTVEELMRSYEADDERLQTDNLSVWSQPTGDAALDAKGIEGLQLGAYRILERAGMGGMGVVYRAEQDDPHRIVALKVMRLDVSGEQLLMRFRREVQLLAQLQHPGIAQVFDSGAFDYHGCSMPYFVMEYVEGLPIDVFAQRHELTTEARCALLIQLCEAVQHAHSRGVLHRDLKPSNVIVVALGDDRIQPKILDFGIARSLDDDPAGANAQTMTGQILGTLSYMSPERIKGEQRADHRADVYSLGVILHELLSGKLPFDLTDRSLAEVAMILGNDEPTGLGSHDTRFRGDLETIVAKALAREPDRRYPSAAAFADDLGRFLQKRPIKARPASPWYLLRQAMRRHRAFFGGLAATLLALIAGLFTAIWFADRNQALAASERTQREEATAVRDELMATVYRSEMRFIAESIADPRGKERARQLLEKWQPKSGDIDFRECEWFLAQQLLQTEDRIVPGPPDAELFWGDDGIDFADDFAWVRLDPDTFTATRRSREPSSPNSIRYSADRRVAVVGGRHSRVVRLADDEVLAEIPLPLVNDVRISPDGRFVAAAYQPGSKHFLGFYDVQEQQLVRQEIPHRLGPRSFEFSNDGTAFAHTITGEELTFWSVPDFAIERRIKLRPGLPWFMQWSPDDKLMAIGYRKGPIDIIDVATGSLVRRLTGHDGIVSELRWSRDQTRLLSACSDSSVRLWNTATGGCRILGGHHGAARRIAWSPDERFVVSSGNDLKLRFFRTDHEPLRRISSLGDPAAWELEWTHDHKTLIIDYESATVFVDPDTGRVIRRIEGRHVRHSSNGRLYSVVREGRLEVRDALIDQLRGSMDAWQGRPTRWHPNREELLACHRESGIWLWTSAEDSWRLLNKQRHVFQFDWHPDGRSIIGMHGHVNGFHLTPGEPAWHLHKVMHPGDSRLWSPSPDGQQYAVRYANREIHIVDLESGAILRSMLGHADEVHWLAWSPTGSRLATIGQTGVLRLWDTATAELVFSFALEDAGHRLLWHPSGESLAVIAGGQTFLLRTSAVAAAESPR